MGTTYTIKIINQFNNFDYTQLKANIDSLLIDYNNYFSTYINDSEISRFNSFTDSNYFNISNTFYDLLTKSLYLNKLTNGAFDITVSPLVELWGFGSNFKLDSLPDPKTIISSLKNVGSNNFIIDSLKIKKLNKLVKIDMSGIAKGAGVDLISHYLKKQNINRFMVEIGGEIYVSGKNKNNNNWKVGIRRPDLGGFEIESYISISNRSLATSGTYENFFNMDGYNYSHIINPVTGYPVKHELVSATVLSDFTYTSDAIATALIVMGHKKALDWTNSIDGVECYLISRGPLGEYKIGISNNFPTN
tara:strand:+ start:204 stop:1115 length:912 start_codon:yes stop_codon:yes gene_type:complete